MKLLFTTLSVWLLVLGQLWAQRGNSKLDSFDQLRQNLLLQYINQLGTSDTINLFNKNVYYIYHEMPSQTLSPVDERNVIRSTINNDKVLTIGYAQTYCDCQSAADIKALPARYFKQTHPEVYRLYKTSDSFWGPAINSTAFFIYCPAKNKRKNELIAIAWFWPATQIMLISNARPEVH